jgi:chromosome partitioning protein
MPGMTRGNHRFVVAVANLKGGTSKTTTAVFLAHALQERGRRVLFIDADPQASAVDWSVLPGIDAVVIDTPPLDYRSGVVGAAVRSATVVLAPVAPTPIEYVRLHAVAKLVQEEGEGFRHNNPVPLAALLTRTVAGTLSARIWREQAEADGYWCLKSEVRFLQQFAQAYAAPVQNASETAYGAVADELLSKEGLV